MGDTRVIDKAQESESRDDTAALLRDDAYGTLKRTENDKTAENGGGQGGSKVDNPYNHLQMAGIALQELQALAGKPDSEKVQVSDAQGQLREVTVGERRAEISRAANSEFQAAISAADRFDQDKVNTTLAKIREDIKKAPDITELERLQNLEKTVESMKHAPSVSRFAYATFLADAGDLAKAKKLLDESASLDGEARNDKIFQEVYRSVEAGLQGAQDKVTGGENPLVVLASADDKRKKGDVAGAEADYKKAIEISDKMDPKFIADQLKAIEQDKVANANNPQALQQIKEAEQAWVSLAHAQAITRVNYADFLNEQKRYDEAMPLLMTVGKNFPDLVKDDPGFKQMLETAHNKGKAPEAFDNPFVHLDNFKKAYESGDLKEARKALEASVNASDKIDRKLAQENKKVVEAQLKEEKDPEKKKALEDTLAMYDTLDHASAFTRIALARFELANKNFNAANTLLKDVQRFDAEFANRPEIEMTKLLEAAVEPSTWEKVWGYTKGILKELACDAVAILAGAGAVLLTGWSGPGAVAAAAVAGGAAYTGMKALMGEEIHWYTPLWGALDGASGGVAAMARTALVKTAGGIVSKEMASATVLKAGGNVAALEGLQGVKMAQTAQVLAKEGLKNSFKNVGFWSKQGARIPFIGAGNAEYRAALAGYRGLAWTNRGVNVGINAGTAAAGSMVYRGGHEGYKYANGEYKSFGEFAQNYGLSVAKDTAISTAIAGPVGGQIGKLGGRIPPASWLISRNPGFASGMYGAWVPASTVAWDAQEQYLKMRQAEAMLEHLQKPPDKAELRSRYYDTPGTEHFPHKKK